jgi:hypothetical protein
LSDKTATHFLFFARFNTPGDFLKDFSIYDNWQIGIDEGEIETKISTPTDDNLLFIKEEQEVLLTRLEAKPGQTREAIIKIISNV